MENSFKDHDIEIMLTKIMRKCGMKPIDEDIPEGDLIIENVVKIILIGTHIDKVGAKDNVFKRTLETVPEINAECFVLGGERLTNFMRSISQLTVGNENPLSIGSYALDENAEAWLDGNKFFQRHAVIVGSTGSGKSWTVARILEQAAVLKSANIIVFDIHGEYKPLKGFGFKHFKIAGPNDKFNEDIIFLPYWLLTYEEMTSMMLDRSDQNAPNQAMAFSSAVINAKRNNLKELKKNEVLENFTIDSPVPYNLESVIATLNEIDTEMIPGAIAGKEKQGTLYLEHGTSPKITIKKIARFFRSRIPRGGAVIPPL